MSDEKKIGFFEIVKLIHPDFNPDIENPSTKMSEVVANKDDEESLYRLAVKWGIIEDDTIEKVDIKYTIDRGKLVRVDQKHEGIIVDFKETKSHLDLYVWVNNEFRRFKRKSFDDQDEYFYVIGYAEDKQYSDLDYKFQVKYGSPQDG